MKSMIISSALLSSVMMNATLPNATRVTYQINDEKSGAQNKEAQSQEDAAEQALEDAFDAFIEEEDVPGDMIAPARPVSACEAYLKEIGVQILMKYIAFKIWLDHQLQSWNKAA